MNHPNLVQTLEVAEHRGREVVVMEYLEGQTLERLWTKRHMPLSMGVSILRDVCGALHYAHELKDYSGRPLHVVHRDVSPSNVFVTFAGQVKLLDFGIAAWAEARHTEEISRLLGKPAYMAPEQARGEALDRRSDVFSVGMLLLELALSRSPYKGLTEAEILDALRRAEVPFPDQLDGRAQEGREDTARTTLGPWGRAPELSRILERALAPEKERRFKTAQEMQAALEGYLKESGSLVTQRELAAFVSSAFSAERESKRKVVGEKLKELSPLVGATRAVGPPSAGLPPRRPPPPPLQRPKAAPSMPPAPSRRPLSGPPALSLSSGPPPPLPTRGTSGKTQNPRSAELRLESPYQFRSRVPGSRLVFHARNTTTSSDVAVKLLRTSPEQDLGARFARLAQLRHPSTARLWDVGQLENRTDLGYLVREFVDGPSLAETLERGHSLAPARAIRLVGEVLLSLSEAHEAGLVHGRIRPDHLLLQNPGTPEETAKVIGYEGKIAKLDPPDTAAYQPPEQHAQKLTAPACDLYACGSLLFRALFGCLPKRRAEELEAPDRDPEGLWRLEALVAFFQRSLAPDPLQRYQTAEDALQALAELFEELPQTSMSSSGAPLWARRSQKLALRIVRNELVSARETTIWVLDDDPAIRSHEIQEAIDELAKRYEVRRLGQADRELAISQLRSGDVLPPWIIMFGDLSVLVDDPVLRTLSACGELSKLLVSSHENYELLQNSINQSGLDYHLSLPVGRGALEVAVESLVRRTRRLNHHYDEVRLALRNTLDQVGDLSRELAASSPPSSKASGTFAAVSFQGATRAK